MEGLLGELRKTLKILELLPFKPPEFWTSGLAFAKMTKKPCSTQLSSALGV